MKKMRWMMELLAGMFLIAAAIVPAISAADEPGMVVGRIYQVEGSLFRYIPEENDWVAVVRDAPFGAEDTLFSGSEGMAELIVPNGTWIRIGNSTQVQFIALDADVTEMDIASGMARFYNKSADTVIQVTSPFGYVLADPGTVFDFYVGENSVEAVAIKGRVDFVHTGTDARYEVSAGSPSILADQQQVSSGEGTVDPEWNRWNMVCENFWATKARVRGRSVEYLPPSLRDEAYVLEENGSWEDVSYDGERRRFWRPHVAVGWSPFTVGRWTDWYGDQTWIPSEPFGYVTHHYGNWIYAGKYWYWAPPVVSVRVGLPLLNIGFFWYPGRVSWIHTGSHVGWVPLAPRETYYSHRHWGGPHAMVVTNVNIAQININVRDYAYANHAVVVNQNNFYRANNYRDVRVTNISRTTIINNYQAAPVVNNTVINHYTTNKQRHNYTNVTVKEKPHNAVINRIQQNQKIIHEAKKEKASMVQERVKGIKEGKVNRETRIEQPKAVNYIVPVNEVNRPKSEVKLQEREIKSRGKSGQQEKPAVRPERVTPPKPSRQEKPVQPARTERLSPVKPSQTKKSPPESVMPATSAQPDQGKSEQRVAPAKPSKQEKPDQPVQPQERVSPAKPAQPAAKPERVTPVKPKETMTQPDKGAVEISKEPRPAKKQIEKVKEPKPSEKDVENRREKKNPEEEKEKRKK
jgi:hypothetical protein